MNKDKPYGLDIRRNGEWGDIEPMDATTCDAAIQEALAALANDATIQAVEVWYLPTDVLQFSKRRPATPTGLAKILTLKQ